MRFPHLAHRSAAAHKLHSTPQQHGMILISGNGEITSRLYAFSLFFPGSCPNNRDRRRVFSPDSDAIATRALNSALCCFLFTPMSHVLWTGQPLAYPAVQKSGAAAEVPPRRQYARSLTAPLRFRPPCSGRHEKLDSFAPPAALVAALQSAD